MPRAVDWPTEAPADLDEQVEAGLQAVKPILGGRHPGVQGAMLADWLAMWLAGHPVELREALLANHVKMVHRLVAFYDKHGLGPEH